MISKNITLPTLLLISSGIVLCFSPGWASQSSTTTQLKIVDGAAPLQESESERLFTCVHQGPAANKTIAVHVSYLKSKGITKPNSVSAEDLTNPENTLMAFRVEQSYMYLKEKNPMDPNNPGKLVSKSVNTGPPHGAIICTQKNYPVFVWGKKAWFIKNKNDNRNE